MARTANSKKYIPDPEDDLVLPQTDEQRATDAANRAKVVRKAVCYAQGRQIGAQGLFDLVEAMGLDEEFSQLMEAKV